MALFSSGASCFETTLLADDNICDAWHIITGGDKKRGRDNAILSEVIIATRCGHTRPGTMATERQHCHGHEGIKLNQQSTVNTEAPKTILKYYEEFYSIKLSSKLLLYYTTVTLRFMPGHRLKQSEYTFQTNVESYGDFICALEEERLTHISQWLFFIHSMKQFSTAYINTYLLGYYQTMSLPKRVDFLERSSPRTGREHSLLEESFWRPRGTLEPDFSISLWRRSRGWVWE